MDPLQRRGPVREHRPARGPRGEHQQLAAPAPAGAREPACNDGAQRVYFDSLTLRHPRPAVLLSQEHHYYPFGLNLKGVAVTTPPTGPISKNQFNAGSELQDELLGEAGVYSTFFRSYDPAIGRFQGVDPLYNFVSGRQ